MNINHYRQKGWVVIENALNLQEVDMVKRIGEDMRLHAADYSTWSGIYCAGNFDYRLFQSYTSPTMKNLAREILGDEVYLFNDQIVIKLPNDRLRFEPHKDNQYGPNSDGSIHTSICRGYLTTLQKRTALLKYRTKTMVSGSLYTLRKVTS